MKLKLLARPLLLLALLFFTVWANATQFVPLSVEQLTERARLVLHGTVLAKTVQRDSAGRIYTKVELQVTEAWKGAVTGGRFILVHAGGVLGEETGAVTGQESYEVGEEVVSFLVLNQRGEGVTLGLAQGKFHVSNDPASGLKLVHNPFHGRPPGTPGESARRATQKTSLELTELKTRVKGVRP
jgi:hypothetical protein